MPLMAVPLTGLDGTTDLFQPSTAEIKPCVCIELFEIELSQFIYMWETLQAIYVAPPLSPSCDCSKIL